MLFPYITPILSPSHSGLTLMQLERYFVNHFTHGLPQERMDHSISDSSPEYQTNCNIYSVKSILTFVSRHLI
jgi:hypothetical protein